MSSARDRFKATLVRAAAISGAMLLVTILTIDRTQAAFSDTTSNVNSLATGSVVIADDDSGSAMFNVTGLTPSSSLVECIEVTYSGTTVPANVRLHGSTTGSLDTYIDTTIEIGTGGSFGSCAGFTPSSTLYTGTLENYATTHPDYASGLAAFTAATNPTVRTFRFTLGVQDNNAAQNLSSNATFVFEAQA